MRALNRQILVLLLAVALIASGTPFAHAVPSHAVVADAAHQHMAHAADAGTDHMMHEVMHHEEAAAEHDHPQADTSDPTLSDLLKGSKCCSMCAIAYVEPSQRIVTVELVSFAVRYDLPTVLDPNELTFVDPEIPIA